METLIEVAIAILLAPIGMRLMTLNADKAMKDDSSYWDWRETMMRERGPEWTL